MGYNFAIMLKRLGQIRVGAIAWIVGGCFVIGAIVFVASQQHAAAKKYEAEREKRCTSTFPLDPEKQDACKHERDSGSDYLPWGYVLFTWPEGITVWALLFTLCVIMYQSHHTRRAANGALLNAEAALKQAKVTEQQLALMFRTERGLLEIKGNGIEVMEGPNQTWHMVGDVQLTNSGNIPLRILSGEGECLALKSGDHAPSIHGRRLQQIGLPNAWIRPKDSGNREGFWTDRIQESRPQFARMLANAEMEIILRGKIAYESHGSAWRRFFAFVWIADKSPEGDEIIKGEWVEDPEAENEEYEIKPPPEVPF
jgi:hypothetical protein